MRTLQGAEGRSQIREVSQQRAGMYEHQKNIVEENQEGISAFLYMEGARVQALNCSLSYAKLGPVTCVFTS